MVHRLSQKSEDGTAELLLLSETQRPRMKDGRGEK